MTKILKISTGEEIIAGVENDANGNYVLTKPHAIIMSREGLGMMPFGILAKDSKITIFKSHVVYDAVADDDLANEYNMKFGMGIVKPTMTIVGS